MKPFIMFVGGKTQLLPTLLPLFPAKAKTYFEPFLGGGAVFFALAKANRFEKAVLNDWNDELANVFGVVRNHPAALMRALDDFEKEYLLAPERVYYGTRDQSPDEMTEVAQAARFIALNKSCFNGLYRVNAAGRFNVSWSKKEKVNTYEEANIRACSAALRSASISEGDFEHALVDAGPGDLVYLDPPYLPISKTSSFTSYTKGGFDLNAHERLAKKAAEVADRGAHVFASNSDHKEIREMWGDRKFEVVEVLAKRAVNCQGAKRGKIKELIFHRKGK